ncbi:MAG: helix-turn-helix transcriptional regulator [Polyangiaceae bacterium]
MTTKRPRLARLSDTAAYLEKLLKRPLTLGGALSALRESDRQSLACFGQRLGVSRSHLSDIEHGRRSVSLQKASEFALALGHHPAQFVRLALQDQVRDAGLKLRVDVHAA